LDKEFASLGGIVHSRELLGIFTSYYDYFSCRNTYHKMHSLMNEKQAGKLARDLILQKDVT
jgi:hypothetical protein